MQSSTPFFPAPPLWLQYGYITLFAVLPWSVEMELGAWNLSFPSEPIIGALTLGLMCYILPKKQAIFELFRQNTFLQVSAIYLILVLISACFSTLYLVSAKFCLVEVAHGCVFALGISIWPDWWRKALPYFVYSMLGVAIYTLIRHAFFDFRADQALLAPMPFFRDHTIWAAALSMVVFLVWKNESLKPVFKQVAIGVLGLALVLSTARAACLSVLIAGFWAVFYLIRPVRRWVFSGFMLVLLGLGTVWLLRHWQPDVSVQERINRWNCSLRMAKERPIMGFGPGSFSFQYLGFQQPEEMTRISVHEPIERPSPEYYGRGGGAHSEYLRVLAESGWLAAACWLFLVGLVLFRGHQNSVQNGPFLLALWTFFAHSGVNEFLHDGKIACIVWGCMAMIFTSQTRLKE